MKIISQYLAALMIIGISCKQSEKNDAINTSDSIKEVVNNIVEKEVKTLQLDHGFVLKMEVEEEFSNFTVYSNFKLSRSSKLIYVDSSNTEYEFSDTLYPMIISTGQNSYELLIETSERPSINLIKRLFISDNNLIRQDTLPVFVGKPTDINGDGRMEYAGVWCYSQVWGENNDLIAYNPILYYSITDNGLKLDSLLTIERNSIIYGAFYGYDFNENIALSIHVSELFNKELDLFRKVY